MEGLPYHRFFELTIGDLKGDLVSALFLEVPVTDYNKEVPFIVGTNVIREYSRLQSAEETIPETWHVGCKSLATQHVCFVKPTSKVCLKSWEAKDMTGFVGKSETVNQPSLKAQKQGTSQM